MRLKHILAIPSLTIKVSKVKFLVHPGPIQVSHLSQLTLYEKMAHVIKTSKHDFVQKEQDIRSPKLHIQCHRCLKSTPPPPPTHPAGPYWHSSF
jgi:cellobiose phosphorylase